MCTVNKQEDPPVVEITRVKSSEKKEAGKESYKRVKSWVLSELKSVDGHSSDGLEFDLTFDKQTFRWIATSLPDKKAFITQLYKVRVSGLMDQRPTSQRGASDQYCFSFLGEDRILTCPIRF